MIFDMDGLMLDTERLAPRAWADAVAAVGVEFDMGLLPAMIGRNFQDCQAMVLERHGTSYPAAALMQAWQEAYDAIVERDGIAIKHGLADLLDWLETEDIPRAVATSTRRERACAKLVQTRLMHRFAALVGGDEIARGKPAPDIFLLAAQRIGHAPADCIVLEDSEPGVRAALAAGMTPIMVPDLQPPSESTRALGHLVVDSLADVHAHLLANRRIAR